MPNQARIQSPSQGNQSDGGPGLVAGLNDLGLEFGTVYSPAAMGLIFRFQVSLECDIASMGSIVS